MEEADSSRSRFNFLIHYHVPHWFSFSIIRLWIPLSFRPHCSFHYLWMRICCAIFFPFHMVFSPSPREKQITAQHSQKVILNLLQPRSYNATHSTYQNQHYSFNQMEIPFSFTKYLLAQKLSSFLSLRYVEHLVWIKVTSNVCYKSQ